MVMSSFLPKSLLKMEGYLGRKKKKKVERWGDGRGEKLLGDA